MCRGSCNRFRVFYALGSESEDGFEFDGTIIQPERSETILVNIVLFFIINAA